MALVMAVRLPHCTATDNLWRRNWVDLSSPVAPLILLPSSLTKARERGPKEPRVSMATDVK